VAHRFEQSCVRPEPDIQADAYGRDVGTLNAYSEANIDLTFGGSSAQSL
jgi:ADP-glucose pyrophosphorylase